MQISEKGDPLWYRTVGEPAVIDPDLTEDLQSDVVIVGAGYTGLSAALHLAERGHSVAVLEAKQVGWGASGRNGGQVIPGLKLDPDDLERRFGAVLVETVGATADLVFSLIEKHSIQCEPMRAGWIQGAHSPRALKALNARVEQWARRGVSVDFLSAEETRALTGTDVYCGGLIDRRAGTIQPLGYARGLARAARLAGARIFGRSPVLSISKVPGGWRSNTAGGSVSSAHVVIATDAYSDRLWPGLANSFLTVRSIQMATKPLGKIAEEILPTGACVSESRKLSYYFRRDAAGRFLIGGRGPMREEKSAESMFAELRNAIQKRYPAIANSEIEHQWSGKVSLTIDQLPHIHDPAPGIHIGHGYNGRGIAVSTLMGALLADRITGGPMHSLFPPSPLQPIPWHSIRQPLLTAAIGYYRLKDALGFGS
jgi:glycine/D-amino acid oxidase-like deaminating enzyme